MPELPEVETSCRGISPYCLNHRIVSIDVRQPKLRWPVDPKLSIILEQQEITAVRRRAKYIILETGKGDLMIHLGMSGSLRVVDSSFPISKHDHIDIRLSNNKIIRYNDPRRFGSFVHNIEGDQHKLLVKLGVEPLTEAFDTNYFYGVCHNRRTSIKALVMNSQIVVGVGNIYAQEALFNVGIHPSRKGNNLSKKRIGLLVEAIKVILIKAIEAGGSSLKDFTAADGKPGYFQQTLEVYGRAGENCNLCKKPLKQSVIGQRTTVYCSNCQK